MQWHCPDNLASWYTLRHPKPLVKEYKLAAGWTQVPYIVAFPNMWPGLAAFASSGPPADRTKHSYSLLPSDETLTSFKHRHHGCRYLVGFRGAIDSATSRGLALFPQFLESEFHGVRSTIEAYSKQGTIERQEAGKYAVAGVKIDKEKGREMDDLFRVTDWKGKVETYKVILWD